MEFWIIDEDIEVKAADIGCFHGLIEDCLQSPVSLEGLAGGLNFVALSKCLHFLGKMYFIIYIN